MNFIQAAILGIVQGLAEFLPISSSGHLVLVQELFELTGDNLLFDVFVHFATLLAVFIYFKKDILAVTRKELVVILVASIPAGIVGVFFEKFLGEAFSSVVMVGSLLLVTGVLNMVTERKLRNTPVSLNANKQEVKTEINFKEALIIGLFQAVAILPGISRSGSTVAAGVLQNIDRKVAFRFSFLMVIPVVLGANMLQLLKVLQGTVPIINPEYLLVGGALAFMSGLFSLKLFEYVITKAKMNIFGIYCFVVGGLVLALSFFRVL